MAHINLPDGIPGIRGPLTAYPHTAKHLLALADSLLVQDTPTFNKIERELIAGYVSNLNQCIFCSESHGAVADAHAKNIGFSRSVWNNPNLEILSEKVKAMLIVAKKVQSDARTVLGSDIEKIKSLGATERDIHDLILIASAFCMFNRYVDGLGTSSPPRNDEAYLGMGELIAAKGYNRDKETI